jgi:hypothetical protein
VTLAAGVAVGELLLARCEPGDHDGDLARIVERLRAAWAAGGPTDGAPILGDLAARIREINERECDLEDDSPARVAARSMSHLGFEFSGAEEADWLASAAVGLMVCAGLGSARELMHLVRARTLPLLLARARGA